MATRTAARHSEDLVTSAAPPDDLAPALAMIGERLARTLASSFARLSGGDAPAVRAGTPTRTTLAAMQEEIEGLAAHALMALDPSGLPLLATFEAAPVFRLVDRTFGGPGEVPEPLPESFPLSAELLLTHLENGLAEALGAAFANGGGEQFMHPLRRDTSLRQLDPFPADTELLALALAIEEPGLPPWSLRLAVPVTTLAATIAAPRGALPRFTPPPPTEEPFASMPLEVTAVLVDMGLSMARLSALRPGDVLPVAVARSIPLQLGGRTLASGTIGEFDDRVAVQITQAF